jgi:hypothetical protein
MERQAGPSMVLSVLIVAFFSVVLHQADPRPGGLSQAAPESIETQSLAAASEPISPPAGRFSSPARERSPSPLPASEPETGRAPTISPRRPELDPVSATASVDRPARGSSPPPPRTRPLPLPSPETQLRPEPSLAPSATPASAQDAWRGESLILRRSSRPVRARPTSVVRDEHHPGDQRLRRRPSTALNGPSELEPGPEWEWEPENKTRRELELDLEPGLDSEPESEPEWEQGSNAEAGRRSGESGWRARRASPMKRNPPALGRGRSRSD